MAEFSKLVITNKGQELNAKLLAGEGTAEFTKVSTSSATYAVEDLQNLDSLDDIQQTALISKILRTNKVSVQVETAFTNVELTVGYYMKALGLYAIDPDDGEILYAVTVETSGNCYMPPYNGITVSGAFVQLVTTVGNAENVELKVNPGAVATIGDIQELQQQISDLRAIVGYTDSDIYGVEVDFKNKVFTRLAGAVGKTPGADFDRINAFGGRRRCNLTNTGQVTAYHGDPDYTEGGKLLQAMGGNPLGTPVQTMVEQPKFYYKVVPMILERIDDSENYHLRKARYYMSDKPKPGFKLHPGFVRDGKTMDKIYLAAFEGCIWDESAGAYLLDDEQVADFAADKLSSIAGAKPASGLTQNLTRANTRALAHNRGTGWEQSYAATVAVSQLLMLIEYASFDMQRNIGEGVSTKTDDGKTSMTEITGGSTSLGNKSGSVNNSNNQNIVSYRGEENPFANIWTWEDGMNTFDPLPWEAGKYGTLYVADHDFTDDTKNAPYVDTGITPCFSTGAYISAFGYSEAFDWLFVPTEVLGNSAFPVGDYFWNQVNSTVEWRVAALGGRWHYGSYCGAFCLSLPDASSHRHRSVGGRLVYVPFENVA